MNGAMVLSSLIWLPLAYLLGSFPSAYLASLVFGKRDIRKVGSGNVGGMNALRNVSPAAGIVTGVLDVGKGALAVWLATRYGGALAAALGSGGAGADAARYAPLAAMVGVVTGHNWMLFLGFRGGKGLGATAGALVVLAPALVLVFGALIGLGALLTRDTNVGAGLAALLMPFAFFFVGHGDLVWVVASLALGLVVAAKHWPDFLAYRAGRRRLV